MLIVLCLCSSYRQTRNSFDWNHAVHCTSGCWMPPTCWKRNRQEGKSGRHIMNSFPFNFQAALGLIIGFSSSWTHNVAQNKLDFKWELPRKASRKFCFIFHCMLWFIIYCINILVKNRLIPVVLNLYNSIILVSVNDLIKFFLSQIELRLNIGWNRFTIQYLEPNVYISI